MSIRKTLGGDRLGSGKKMQVELHGFERSTHDTGFIFRSTMSAGTLVPFMKKIALPGDTFDINLDCDVKTLPTIGPLFGSFKVQLDLFMAPIRLYNSHLHNNRLGIGMDMDKVKFPVIKMQALPLEEGANIENSQINPSCILKYLGISGIGNNFEIPNNIRYFNGISFLAYWEIYKNYYANKQEGVGAVIAGATGNPLIQTVDSIFGSFGNIEIAEAPAISNVVILPGETIDVNYTGAKPNANEIYLITSIGTKPLSELADLMQEGAGFLRYMPKGEFGQYIAESWRYRNSEDLGQGKPRIRTFPLENIDLMREKILGYSSMVAPFEITEQDIEPYYWPVEVLYGYSSALYSQEGLALKTYQSDLFNTWLDTEWIDGTTGINSITAIDVSSGELQIPALILARKVYDMLNRIAVSGGSYDDWIDAQWAHERYRRCESPMYMGGLIKELVFQEVVSNSEAGNNPLGTLAGKGVMGKKHKGGNVTIKVDEPSYIIGIVSLTPRVDYSQGNEWDVNLKTMNDLHVPSLDQIGFQDLITEQMAWWDTEWDSVTNKWVQRSAGKQPAWINYMTDVNRTYGNFAIEDNQMFMTLNRRYEYDKDTRRIKDLTTYIDPSKFNFIFAQTSLDAQNFWTQIAVDITARRKMSAKVMPNL